MVNGMGAFFKSQGPNILTLVIMFLAVLALFRILGVDFDPQVDKHVSKVVTVESMGTLHSKHSDCTKLNYSRHCGKKSDCVWTQGKNTDKGHCVGGSRHGPTYPFDEDGNRMYDDSFYYLGKLKQ